MEKETLLRRYLYTFSSSLILILLTVHCADKYLSGHVPEVKHVSNGFVILVYVYKR